MNVLGIKFQQLKNIDFESMYVSLVMVKEYKRNRESQYAGRYVQIDGSLETRLKNIIQRKIEYSNSYDEYAYDCPEPEEGLVRTINYDSTDFIRILENINLLNPEEDKIDSLDELVKAKAYIILLKDDTGQIVVAGFKTIPENWKMKKAKGLISLLFRENRFEDLDEGNVFSISNTIDFIFYSDIIFILSKKNFETGLNFREGMIAKAQTLYDEVRELALFVNLDILISKVGDNQHYLRKIATIKNLGYYRDQRFLQNFKEVNDARNWGVEFNNGQIIITEEKLDDILTILQNKRLYSELTNENFDVESVKRLGI